MGDSNSANSSIRTADDVAGEKATETFALLGNETRLSILLALWEAIEPFADDNAVPFSALRDRVGVSDSGQFNYHLDKLADHFIHKTDTGYELRGAGHRLVRTVIADAGIEDPSFEPIEVNADCPFCDAPVALTYQDELLFTVCTECDGAGGTSQDWPGGVISYWPFPRAGTVDRSPEEMATTKSTRIKQQLLQAAEGVCSRCAGPIEASLDVCEVHAADGVCETCGQRHAITARFTCPVCKVHLRIPPSAIVDYHPAVISFYHERGVPLLYETDDFESTERRHKATDHEQELVSKDPLRVQVRVEYEGDELWLTMDDSMSVIEVADGA